MCIRDSYHAAYVLKPVARKTDVIYAAKLSQGYDLYLKRCV